MLVQDVSYLFSQEHILILKVEEADLLIVSYLKVDVLAGRKGILKWSLLLSELH